MIAGIVDLVRPTQAEIEEMAVRETQIAHRADFRPICAGWYGAIAILLFIGIAAAPVGIWRIGWGLIRRGGS